MTKVIRDDIDCAVSIPHLVKPALHSLLDSLCCHVTSTSWDELFRKALVAAGHQHSRHITNDTAEVSTVTYIV